MPSLIAVLGLNDSGFRKGLTGAEQVAQRSGDRIGSALSGSINRYLGGAAVIGLVTTLTKSLIDQGSKISDTAKKLEVGVERVQELGFAAKLSGTQIDAVGNAFTKLKDAVNEVAMGSDAGWKLAESFGRVGVTLDDLKSKSADELFSLISSSVERTGATTSATGALLDILGKSAAEIIPMMKQLNELTAEFREKELGLKKEDIAVLDEAGDDLDRLEFKAKNMFARSWLFYRNLWTGQWVDPFVDHRFLRREIGQGAFGMRRRVAERDAVLAALREKGPVMESGLKSVFQLLDAMLPKLGSTAKLSDMMGTPVTDEAKAAKAVGGRGGVSMSLNALQSVGGFAPAPPEQRRMVTLTEQISANVATITNKLEEARSQLGGVQY